MGLPELATIVMVGADRCITQQNGLSDVAGK